MDKIVLFQDSNGKSGINVRLDGDTVWLTQQQMAEVFETSQQNIALHLKNIFAEGELDDGVTHKDFLLVRPEGWRSVSRAVAHYNLDAIISVGYRVNSKQGVKFRQWATRTLNEHLTMGFTLNQQRLAERGVNEAQTALNLLVRTLSRQESLSNESRELLALVESYSKTWSTLLQYDEDRLPEPVGTTAVVDLDYVKVKEEITRFKAALTVKNEATALFGQERGDSLAGIIGNIDQVVFGEPVYKSAEERAANLFYFIVKDHPFSDGNKRIASFMLLRYLQMQEIPVKINPDALSALTLLVAESDSSNKTLMTRLVMNGITQNMEWAEDARDEDKRTISQALRNR